MEAGSPSSFFTKNFIIIITFIYLAQFIELVLLKVRQDKIQESKEVKKCKEHRRVVCDVFEDLIGPGRLFRVQSPSFGLRFLPNQHSININKIIKLK